MTRWIRPTGVLGFVALLAVVIGTWWLLSGWLLKMSIESIGTRLVGARVQVDSANLTFSPLGFHLRRLQVTDPDKPMQNMVEVASVGGTVEPWKLFFGHVIIDDMTAEGMSFNTPRKTSGAIRKAAKTIAQPGERGAALNALQAVKKKLPSVDEIMQREQLITVKRVNDLRESEKTQRARVEQAIKALPDEGALKAYKRQIDELTGAKVQSLSDLQRSQEQLKTLKDQLRKDKAAVEDARKQIAEAKQALTTQFAALKEAPLQDLRHIREQYGLSAAGASSLTRLVFGDEAQKWFDVIRTWYGRIVRLLPSGPAAPQPARPPRGEGHFIHFHELRPLPDFLIRRASASATVPVGVFAVTLQDVTPQPQVLGRPARLDARGQNLPNARAAHLTGVFDHVNPDHPKDSVDWQVSDWRVTGARVTQSDALTLTLANAMVNVTGSAGLTGGTLDADAGAAFHGAQWTSQAKQDWAAQLASALSSIKSFDVRGKMLGSLDSPSLSLQSNLDEQIKAAVLDKLKTQGSELERKLKARLSAQVDQATGPYDKEIAAITDTQGTLQSRLNQLDGLLKAELQSAVKSQQDKAKKKLEDKLKKGLGF